MGLVIAPSNVMNQIEMLAREAYPKPCEGLLVGHAIPDQWTLHQVVPIKNLAKDIPKAERLAENFGLQLLGAYRTHPDSSAVMNEHDRFDEIRFRENMLLLIVAVEKGSITERRAYCEDHDGVHELRIQIPSV